MGLQVECDSQGAWLKGRLYTGLSGNSITNLNGTDLLGRPGRAWLLTTPLVTRQDLGTGPTFTEASG